MDPGRRKEVEGQEEKQEQQLLRREYVDSMKNNLRATLQNVVIKHPDGSRTKLKK